MTEDEAKTKMCCGPKPIADTTIMAGGGTVTAIPGNCIASGCMAWRHGVIPVKAAGIGMPVLGRDGWCGLAGTP